MSENASPGIFEVVLPIVEVEQTDQGLSLKQFLGTGFLIGSSNYLMTADHVLRQQRDGHAVALRVVDGAFSTIALFDIVRHPKEDVAVCRVELGEHVRSWLVPVSEPHHQSLDCHIWGYPADALFDHGQRDLNGRVLQRPELVFTKAHIRRRVTYEVPGFRGNHFFELNESAGAGCSGAPVLAYTIPFRWHVCGIYMGEVTSERNGQPMRSRGYAVRMQAVADWLRAIDPALIA